MAPLLPPPEPSAAPLTSQPVFVDIQPDTLNIDVTKIEAAITPRPTTSPMTTSRWTVIEPLPAAAGDPVVGKLPPGAVALHWNEDGFEPPQGAVELLARPAGTSEAFRYGECAWGVQFHPEVHPAGLEGWYRSGLAELGEAGVSEAEARAADARHLPGQSALSAALFGGFARVVAARCVTA